MNGRIAVARRRSSAAPGAVVAFVLTALLASPTAWACASCTSVTENGKAAYLTTAAFLSLLPLSFVGAMVWWLWRAARRDDVGREVGREPR